MKIFKKLDRSSKLLLLTAVLGFVLSLVGFWWLNNYGHNDGGGLASIGKIKTTQNDVRVKRSENIHWYPVNQDINCYEDDLIFTGNDSTTEIELSKGNRIVIYPNSLVSLSKGVVTLESGSIEIDLSKGGEQLKLNSFGEEIAVAQNAKLRVMKNEDGKKIIPLNQAAEAIKQTAQVQKYVAEEKIRLITPESNIKIPKHPAFRLKLAWQTTTRGPVTLEFFTQKNSPPFLTETTSERSIEMSSDKFPDGTVFWKASQGQVHSETNHFNVTSNLEASYIKPAMNEAIPLEVSSTEEITFDWSVPVSLPQTIQISDQSDFSNKLFDRTGMETKAKLKINREGQYFWRVGLVLSPETTYWSRPATFIIKPEIKIRPIQLAMKSKILDFNLEKAYGINILDENPCEEYQSILSRDNKVLSNTTLKHKSFRIGKLNDGLYDLKVVCKFKGNTTETQIQFEVKSSKPLKAPKILDKSKKLFVKYLNHVMDFIFPSAHAADDGVLELAWENDGSDFYEVEIMREDGKPLLKKTIKGTSFKLKISQVGKYLWRVRSNQNNTWGPFSEYATIDATDKVSLLNEPLMTFPGPGTEILAEGPKVKINFTWKTPLPGLTYKLELYKDQSGKPFKSIALTGNEKSITFSSTFNKVWWRVTATSRFGNQSPNMDRYQFYLAQKKVPEKPKQSNKYIFMASLAQTMSSYEQKVGNAEIESINATESMSGQTLWTQLQIFPRSWNSNAIINLGLEYLSLASGSSKFSKIELYGEYGKRFWKQSDRYHSWFAGIHQNLLSFDVNTASSNQLSMGFVSGRYVYTKQLTEKSTMDISAEMRLLVRAGFVPPSFKLWPQYNYKLKQNLYLTGFLSYENVTYKAPYDEEDIAGDLTITMSNISGGVGVRWLLN